ncbi:MAG: hypothetical protein CM1200mP40_27880 [Gammaproteobacteria bacterium]|nr:MAG: hypothetical protein CM1200mP40_27880 [Gammaproteobacteria bacterium]
MRTRESLKRYFLACVPILTTFATCLSFNMAMAKDGLDISVRKFDIHTLVLSEPCLEIEGERFSFEFVLDSDVNETVFRALEHGSQILDGSDCISLRQSNTDPTYFYYHIPNLVVFDGNLDTGLRYDVDSVFETKNLQNSFVVTDARVSSSSLADDPYIMAPPEGYSLEVNNIGSYNATKGKIFSCLSPYTDGILTPISGQTEFGISFEIVSVSEAIIGVAGSTSFNSNNLTGADGKRLSCSGSYETTTGLYQDVILVGSDLLKVSFLLLDSSLLTFKLTQAETLQKTVLLNAISFNPAQNSKTMPVENNIGITFSSSLAKGEGLIILKDSQGNTVESYQASSSPNVTIAGANLSINPTDILASDTSYSINIPVGAVRDSAGNNLGEAIEYDFRTQIDVAFMLLGYNGTTLYETTDAFKATAELATTQMGLLSFNRITSFRTHMLPVSSYDGEYADSKAQIEAIDSALDNWGSGGVFSNFYAEFKTNPNALRNPTADQISVLNDLRDWLVENQKGAVNWKDTDLGRENYQWILDKVLIASSAGARFLLDGLRMPAGFEVNEYRTVGIILSSDDSYNTGAMASSFNSWGGQHWNISDSDGNKYTHYQPFFYDDHSELSPGGDPEKIKKGNAQVIMHEWVHTLGGGHDQDPSCISPYSFMTACEQETFSLILFITGFILWDGFLIRL